MSKAFDNKIHTILDLKGLFVKWFEGGNPMKNAGFTWNFTQAFNEEKDFMKYGVG